MAKTVWGVLSTARIGVNKVIPALQASPLIEVRAIASRDAGKARDAAQALNISVAYDDYQALIDDPDIEAVYNPLPNHLHVPLTLACARAGKHVLCEKPFSLTAGELEQLREVADRVHIMEAFMVRHSRQWAVVRGLVAEGRIGEARLIQAHFLYDNPNPSDIRNDVAIGGGGLFDIGCYPIVTGRFFFDSEPCRAMAMIDRDPAFQTDRLTSGMLDFGQGRQLVFSVATRLQRSQGVTLYGTKGHIFLPLPYNPLSDAPATVLIEDADGAETLTLPAHNQYTEMGEAFTRAVRGETPLPYGLNDARANMRVIDALFASERSGAWQAITT